MKQRVTERLNEMREARVAATDAAATGTGRALAVRAKREMTAERFQLYTEECGLSLTKAHPAGMAASNRVALAASMLGGKDTPKIGKG